MNINKSDIFKIKDEWIVTKNTNDELKVAFCKEDESRIFDKTKDWIVRNKVEPGPSTTLLLENFEKNKIVNLFINDLLSTTKVDEYFQYKNIYFSLVEITGVITSVYTNSDKKSIVVDDGTNSIICIFQSDFGVEDKGRCEENLTELYNILENNPINELIKAAIIMERNSKMVLQSVPEFEKINLGDSVNIIGKLSEYNNNKYIFIRKIIKPSIEINICRSLEERLNMYENVYK